MNSAHTLFIQLNTHHCEACWKCLEVCPQHVLGRINLFFHKHAKIVEPQKCIGCMKCVKVCPHGALTKAIKKDSVC